jgi:hypothetical protein
VHNAPIIQPLAWAVGLGALVCGLLRPVTASAKPPVVVGVVEVQAGRFERRDTTAWVQLPPTLVGQPLELLSRDGSRQPVQVDSGGAGGFVIGTLPKGQHVSYRLAHARSASTPREGVSVERDPNGLWLGLGKQRILRYQALGVAPRPEVAQHFVRGGYLHPLLTPGGAMVTDDYPPEEEHHHGIWTAWTSTSYQGRTPDFWNMGKGSARKDHVAIDRLYAGPVFGGFIARLTSTDLGTTPPTPVLQESWGVVAYRTHAGKAPYHLFDLTASEQVLGKNPLLLPEYRYGGLGVRGARSWSGPDGAQFLTSEGKGRLDGENTRVRWCYLGGLLQGKRAGVAVLIHPQNFRAPQPVRLHPKDPYFSVAPVKAGAFSLEPGQLHASRYRVVVSDGAPDPILLERLWNDFADPPTASFRAAVDAR